MLDISDAYKNKLQKASEKNPFTPERIQQLKEALNNTIAKQGIDNTDKDVVEMAKFLNSVEGSALDFVMQGASFGFSDEILGNFSSLPSNFATDVERYGMEVYRQRKPLTAAFS